MKKSDTWMPLYIGDYLADTSHLSGLEHGAYLLLLMHQWRNGPIPNDGKKLAAICRIAQCDWDAISETILSFFEVTSTGKLSQKRLAKERREARDITKKRSEAGKKGAESRWAGHNGTNGGSPPSPCEPVANANGKSMANASEGHRQNDGPSPSPIREERAVPSELALVAPPLPEIDIRQKLWRDGIPIIRSLVGYPDGRARSLLGRLVKGSQDDCARVLNALHEAASMRPADPVPWLMAACTRRTTAAARIRAEVGTFLLPTFDDEKPPGVELLH